MATWIVADDGNLINLDRITAIIVKPDKRDGERGFSGPKSTVLALSAGVAATIVTGTIEHCWTVVNELTTAVDPIFAASEVHST